MSHLNVPPEVRKSHFLNVVAVATADGKLAAPEKAILEHVASAWGLTASDVQQVLEHPETIHVHLPTDPHLRFRQLYDVVECMIIDEVMKSSEKALCKVLARALDFDDHAVDQIVQGIIAGNRLGLDDDAIRARVEASLK